MMLTDYKTVPGADPGFPVGGDANPPEGGTNIYDFAKFTEKLHEIEKILDHRGSARRRHPFGSATECVAHGSLFSSNYSFQ